MHVLGLIAYVALLAVLASGLIPWALKRYYFDTPRVRKAREDAELAETEAWLASIRASEDGDR